MREGAFRTSLRVRYSEVDAQNIVFNTRYLEYIDVGLTEFLRERGILLPHTAAARTFDTALVKATVEYLAPATLDQLIDIYAWLDAIGTKSFTMRFELYPHDADEPLLVRATMIYVNYSVERRAAVPIPPEIRAALEGKERYGP